MAHIVLTMAWFVPKVNTKCVGSLTRVLSSCGHIWDEDAQCIRSCAPSGIGSSLESPPCSISNLTYSCQVVGGMYFSTNFTHCSHAGWGRIFCRNFQGRWGHTLYRRARHFASQSCPRSLSGDPRVRMSLLATKLDTTVT